jgi:hypothetical protein
MTDCCLFHISRKVVAETYPWVYNFNVNWSVCLCLCSWHLKYWKPSCWYVHMHVSSTKLLGRFWYIFSEVCIKSCWVNFSFILCVRACVRTCACTYVYVC